MAKESQLVDIDGQEFSPVTNVGTVYVPNDEDPSGFIPLMDVVEDFKDDVDGFKDDLTKDGVCFHLDKQDDVWGWNESSERGADTFHPFKSAPIFAYLGTGGTYDIKTLYPKVDYTKLTLSNNFAIAVSSASGGDPYYIAGVRGGGASYDATTGILTVTNGELYGGKFGSFYGSPDTKVIGSSYTKAWIVV